MAAEYGVIDASLSDFIERQKVFFVATAPRADDGFLNLSPKGLNSLRVVDEKTVVYADLTGSGIETVAHLKENGRIVLMFCAFEGPPKIVRLYGMGDVIEPGHAEFAGLQRRFSDFPGLRSFIRVRCTRISDACGYAVPRYDFREDRSQLIRWAEKLGEDGVAEYRRAKNSASIDGLPGLTQDPD